MAGVSECFAIGSIVACKTCYNKVVEGEVQAFDPHTKMLILNMLLELYNNKIMEDKQNELFRGMERTENTRDIPGSESPASNGRSSCNNVYIVNLSLVSDVQVKKEVSSPPEPPKLLNLEKITARVRRNVESKRCLIAALKAGVTEEGMLLFHTISKTITEVTWEGQNIVIMNQVTITPPYKTENILGDDHSKAYTHIRKVVEKHLRDTQVSTAKQSELTDGKISSSPASSGVVAQSQ